jgi:hypothetical protein
LEGEIEKRHIYSIKNESSKPMSTCYICGLGHEIKIILWKANKKNYETQLKKKQKNKYSQPESTCQTHDTCHEIGIIL